jgi:hypothetical protein
LGRRNGLKPEILGLVRLVHIGNGVGPPAAGPEEDALDFGDTSEFDPQSETQEKRRACFHHGTHVGDLPELGIGKNVSVLASTLGGFPKTITQADDLVVFGVFDVCGNRQAFGIMRHYRGKVLINDILKTGAVAVEGNRSHGRMDGRSETTNEDGCHGEPGDSRKNGSAHGVLLFAGFYSRPGNSRERNPWLP